MNSLNKSDWTFCEYNSLGSLTLANAKNTLVTITNRIFLQFILSRNVFQNIPESSQTTQISHPLWTHSILSRLMDALFFMLISKDFRVFLIISYDILCHWFHISWCFLESVKLLCFHLYWFYFQWVFLWFFSTEILFNQNSVDWSL